MKKVAVIMGSKSDAQVVKPAFDILKEFGVETEVRVMSAHRTPDEVMNFSRSARKAGFGAIICAAGKAAHLAGVVASGTTLPVIGIPVKSSALEGMDALLSTIQMPPGIPVATVAIDGAKNAGLLALEILSVYDDGLQKKLDEYRKKMSESVLSDDAGFSF